MKPSLSKWILLSMVLLLGASAAAAPSKKKKDKPKEESAFPATHQVQEIDLSGFTTSQLYQREKDLFAKSKECHLEDAGQGLPLGVGFLVDVAATANRLWAEHENGSDGEKFYDGWCHSYSLQLHQTSAALWERVKKLNFDKVKADDSQSTQPTSAPQKSGAGSGN